ncbi:MAG: hypothetical protein JOY54_11940 [Acidobacteriaceae bacterium]|nr:hypothetical protein [Acidobacteriaceae bacterium]
MIRLAPRTGKTSLLLYAACLVLVVLTLFRYWEPPTPKTHLDFWGEPFYLAVSLALGHGYQDPFPTLSTGPSAHIAPGFPALLSLIIVSFGTGTDGAQAMLMSAALATAIIIGLLPIVSHRLGLGYLPGFIAASAWLVAKIPLNAQFENAYAGLLTLAVIFFLAKLPQDQYRQSTLLLLGTAIGLLALFSPTCVAPTLASVVWLAPRVWRPSGRRYWTYLILIPALFIIPWITRNYVVLHRFVPLRDNFGLELAVSNNDCAPYGMLINIRDGCFNRVHPSRSFAEARRVRTLGEPRYNDVRLHEAAAWIKTHQSRFWQLTYQRALAFWFPYENGSMLLTLHYERYRAAYAMIYTLTILSIPGLFLLARSNRSLMVLFGIWLVLFPVPYYVIQYHFRYRMPILWITFLVGSLPLARIAETLWARLRTGRTIDVFQPTAWFLENSNQHVTEKSRQ